MGTLMDIIGEEKNRLERLEQFYMTALSKIPKGYLSLKKIKGNIYYYRAFRDGGTVRTVYLGRAESDEVVLLKSQIAERKRLESLLKRTRENLKEARSVFRGKR